MKHIVIRSEAELLAYLDRLIDDSEPDRLPPIKFSKEMLEAVQFKISKKDREEGEKHG